MDGFNHDDLPSSDDERWAGNGRPYDGEETESLKCAMCELESVRFMQMTGGGPHDGGLCVILEIKVKRSGEVDPVYVMFNPSDSMGLVSACLGLVDDSDSESFYEDS